MVCGKCSVGIICYRRDDTAWVPGRLYDLLAEHFGAQSVFMDVDTSRPVLRRPDCGHWPAPKGAPRIEITFDIDANGILNVSARKRSANNERRLSSFGSAAPGEPSAEEAQRAVAI